MKLITIGNSPSANIRLKSKFVSSLHAEILLFDNGDIILTDKGSKNGTYVQNQKVEPEKDVTIRRGDSIRFADVYLDWNMIPPIQVLDPTKVKGIYGIGSNFRNKYQLVGSTVSRFHATFKEMKNGQWFIRDHSRNGTTLNGARITPEMDYRIKAKDVIVCGGVPCPNPVPASPSRMIWKLSAAAVAVVLLAFVIKMVLNSDEWRKPTFEDMTTASAMVYGTYHYVVTLEDDPFIGLIQDWPREYFFGRDVNTKEPLIMNAQLMSNSYYEYVNNNIVSYAYTGTAFFISDDGRMATNRHVANPWYGDENYIPISHSIRQQMIEMRNEQIKINELHSTFRELNDDLEILGQTPLGVMILNEIKKVIIQYQGDFDRLVSEISKWNGLIMRYKNSNVKITGAHDYLGVAIANHKYSSLLEFDRCTVLKVSDNPAVDLAIIQLNNGALPASVKFKYDLNKCIMNPKELKIQGETYYSIGYPGGDAIGLDPARGLQPRVREVKISKLPGEYNFELQGESIGGSSGSPICNRKGQLLGVIWGGSTKIVTESLGVHARLLKEMNDKIY